MSPVVSEITYASNENWYRRQTGGRKQETIIFVLLGVMKRRENTKMLVYAHEVKTHNSLCSLEI